MRSTSVPRLRRTCSAVVGEISVKRLALGAASGISADRMRASATGCAGMRRATVLSPAVTMSGMAGCFFTAFLTTTVSGPGQNFLVSKSAVAGHSAARDFAISIDATWTISGPGCGTRFHGIDFGDGDGIEGVRSEAVDGFGGKPTRRPARRSLAARAISAAVGIMFSVLSSRFSVLSSRSQFSVLSECSWVRVGGVKKNLAGCDECRFLAVLTAQTRLRLEWSTLGL